MEGVVVDIGVLDVVLHGPRVTIITPRTWSICVLIVYMKRFQFSGSCPYLNIQLCSHCRRSDHRSHRQVGCPENIHRVAGSGWE